MSVSAAHGPEVRVSVPSSGVRDKGHLSVAFTHGADVTYVSTDTACEGGDKDAVPLSFPVAGSRGGPSHSTSQGDLSACLPCSGEGNLSSASSGGACGTENDSILDAQVF